MPNYNHADCISVALDAILSQSFKPLEVIVIDDASTDESLSILQQYEEKFPEVKVYRHSTNLGPVAAVNWGIKIAQGEYLAFCSADDRVLPDFFLKTMTILQQYPKLGLCCSDPCFFLDQDFQNIEIHSLNISKQPLVFSSEEVIGAFRRTSFYISTPSSIYRREVVIKEGGYLQELKMLSDWFLNCKIALFHGAAYIPEPLASQRNRSDKSSYSAKLYAKKQERNRVYIRILEEINSPRELEKMFTKSLLFYQLGRGALAAVFAKPKYWKWIPLFCVKKALRMMRKAFNLPEPLPVKGSF